MTFLSKGRFVQLSFRPMPFSSNALFVQCGYKELKEFQTELRKFFNLRNTRRNNEGLKYIAKSGRPSSELPSRPRLRADASSAFISVELENAARMAKS